MKQVDENNVQMGEFSAKDIAVAGYPLLWAKSFWAFNPYINHLRNLSKQYVRWAPQEAIPPKSHRRTERQGHPPASEKHPLAPEKQPHSVLPSRSPPSKNEPGQKAPYGTLDNS